jgi:urease gamma subunit
MAPGAADPKDGIVHFTPREIDKLSDGSRLVTVHGPVAG